jgi:hypothetical protein
MSLSIWQSLTWATVLGAVLCALWLSASSRAVRDEALAAWPNGLVDVFSPRSPAHGAAQTSPHCNFCRKQ